jgi:hypothetical protein
MRMSIDNFKKENFLFCLETNIQRLARQPETVVAI